MSNEELEKIIMGGFYKGLSNQMKELEGTIDYLKANPKMREACEQFFDNPNLVSDLEKGLKDYNTNNEKYNGVKQEPLKKEDDICEKCTSRNCGACYKKRLENSENEPLHRPSELVTDEATKTRVHGLVEEFLDTMVRPYAAKTFTDEQFESMHGALNEFACWLLTKK